MKILTNEYLCNTPDFTKPTQGGPANFARLFFNFLNYEATNYEWQGLIIRDLDPKNETSFIKKLPDTQSNRSIYKYCFPFHLAELIMKAKTKTDPRKILAQPIKELSIFIKKLSPDIVFLNGFSLGNWIILEAARLAKKPIIIQHAGIWTAELELYKDFYSVSGLKILKEMEKDSTNFSDAEIFLNDFSKKYFDQAVLNNKRSSKDLVKIIPLPVDFKFFKDKKSKKLSFNFDKNKFNIGIIARWDRIKNHQAIAELASLINNKKLPWSIYAITKIPPTKKNFKIKKLYRENVNIMDHMSKEMVGNFCRENDLIIIPSKFDVSPTVLLESLACKTPVAISKNVGFVDDFYNNKANNWIINFEDPKTALKQIEQIRKIPLPENLIKDLKNKHELKKVFKQYLSLFNEVIIK